mgnify:CR=1
KMKQNVGSAQMFAMQVASEAQMQRQATSAAREQIGAEKLQEETQIRAWAEQQKSLARKQAQYELNVADTN